MEPTTERWAPVTDYEGLYWISDLGRVRSARRTGSRGGILRPRLDVQGRLFVTLSRAGVRREWRVHRLVAEAFLGACPPGMEACHNNGDETDNRTINLRWGTKSANVLDSVQHGTHLNASKTHCPQGHAYTPENTSYRRDRYGRRCRACHRERRRTSP